MRLISSWGCDVYAAADCAEARCMIHALEGRLDLLLGDVVLPDGDGAELMREVMRDSQCAVLIVTARCQDSDHQRYAALGLVHCLNKPVTGRRLREEIEELLLRRCAGVPR